MRYEANPSNPNLSWKIWPLLAIALSVAGCAVADADAKKAKAGGEVAEAGKVRKVQPNQPDGDKKVGTGRSYIGQTKVDVTPMPAAAPGWFSEQVASGEDDWEPAIAVDPGNPNFVYQLITRYTGPKPCGNCKMPAIRLRRSTDGGATWTDSWLLQTTKAQYDPQIMVDINGNVHAAFLNGTTPGSTYLKSTNHGVSWGSVKDGGGNGAKPQWNDHPWLGLSRNGNDIYIGFNSSDSYAVASHNGGLTWSNPVKMNTDARYYFHQGVAVSPTNGNIAYIATSDYSSGNNYNGDSFVKVWKTTNGGTSWTSVPIDTSKQVPPCAWAAGCGQGFFGTTPSMAIDSAGKLLIAYHINTVDNAPEQMYIRTSTDGVTWTPRLQISVANSAVNNAFPAVAAHPTTANDFRVTWQDDRLASTTGFNTWYRRTTNGGTSWSTDIRASDLTSGAPYKNANGYLFPYGDYQELAVDQNGFNHLIWGEGTSYTGPGGCWYARGTP